MPERIEVVKALDAAIKAIGVPKTREEQDAFIEGIILYLSPIFCSRHSLGHDAIPACVCVILQACEDFKEEWRAENN